MQQPHVDGDSVMVSVAAVFEVVDIVPDTPEMSFLFRLKLGSLLQSATLILPAFGSLTLRTPTGAFSSSSLFYKLNISTNNENTRKYCQMFVHNIGEGTHFRLRGHTKWFFTITPTFGLTH